MIKKYIILTLLTLMVGCSTTTTLPDPRRDHKAEVRSDCRSWITVWVRDRGKIKTVSLYKVSEIKNLGKLQLKLKKIGVDGSLKSLRYIRIAKRRRELPLSEYQVVEQFIFAGKEIIEE